MRGDAGACSCREDICDQLRVMDLGCGTGLAGECFASIAQYMVGCDLSSKMIEKAEEKGCYDQLFHEEIVAALARFQEPEQLMDLVIASDVLCYIGDLNRVHTISSASIW